MIYLGMPGSGFTIGAFLNYNEAFTTNPGVTTATVITGQNQLNNTLNNTIFDIAGPVTLTNGQIVEGMASPLASNVGAQRFGLHNYTWSDGDGTFSFEVVYGKWKFSPPAQLDIELPLTLSATPIPAALPLFATGLGGLGLLSWRGSGMPPYPWPSARVYRASI
jgi:hypothetical protein